MSTEVKSTTPGTERELIKGVFFAFLANPTNTNRMHAEDAIKSYQLYMADRDEKRRDGHPTYRQQVGRAKRNLIPDSNHEAAIGSTTDRDDRNKS